MARKKAVRLNAEQEAALASLKAGENVFLTGEAGTGKSFVLNAYLDWCAEAGRRVLPMAPTGIAALNIKGGSTIHRSLGLPAHMLDPNEAVGLPRKVLKVADTIVIDEISMVRIDLFERVAKMIIAAQKASGAKQLVVVGDFSQLPPVVTADDEPAMLRWWPGNVNGYCFKSVYWKSFGFKTHMLHKIMRQDDAEYIEALNEARNGDASCLPFFNAHRIRKREDADPRAIWLCARNSSADAINQERLDRLPGDEWTFTAVETGKLKKSDQPTASELSVKVGARVMSVANAGDGSYQNGSIGSVIAIDGEADTPTITVAFDNGKTCVLEPKRWQVLKSTVQEKRDPETGEMKAKLVAQEVGSFQQMPLRLAWAVTIHKSQGQTFDKCVVETNTFSAGQLYVGLSRCSNADGLQVYPKIDPRAFKAQPEVAEFYEEIEEQADWEETMIPCPAKYVVQAEEYIHRLITLDAARAAAEAKPEPAYDAYGAEAYDAAPPWG